MPHRVLSNWTKFFFGLGAVGETAYMAMFNTFIGIYYNQAVGLSNSLIGTAILLALVADAVSDPSVGILSDRWKSKFGRRHPFLFIAPIPLALGLWMIFNPPAAITATDTIESSNGQLSLFAWLAFWSIITRLALTLYAVPHMALGGELSNDPRERSQVFSINALIGYTSGAMFTFIAWSVFLSGETTGADGVAVSNHLKASYYGPLTLFAGALILICVSFCAFGTYSRIPYLSQPRKNQERLSIYLVLGKIVKTLKNRNYLYLVVGFFFFMVSSGLYETFNVFIATYFWELKPEEMRWLALSFVPGIVVGASISPKLMHIFDRRPVLIGSIIIALFFAQLAVDLRLLGLFPENGSPMLLPALIANTFGFGFGVGMGAVTVPAMLGDIVDQHDLETGHREEGLFYSARSFFAKMSFSVAFFIGGIILDYFVRLPFDAVPGQIPDDVVFRLGLAAGPVMAVGGIFAVYFYARYDLNKSQQKEVRRQLQERPPLEQESISI